MMIYRKAETRDIKNLAYLHKKNIHWGFLTSLGENVLRWVYHALVMYRGGVVIVAEDRGRIAGFVSGVENLKGYYAFFFKRYFFRIVPLLFTKLFSIRKILETLLYPKKSQRNLALPSEELLSIVVDGEYQGQGIAKGLYEELRKWFKSRGVSEFKTTVGEDNLKSIKFFQKIGCREEGVEEIHKGERSKVFVCG